jgi:hypothetical protein
VRGIDQPGSNEANTMPKAPTEYHRGTPTWNKIEHKMFSYITKNWRGKPLITRETVAKLISNTKTTKRLEIRSMPDENVYDNGIKVTDAELAAVNLVQADFYGDWNYTIMPQIARSNWC